MLSHGILRNRIHKDFIERINIKCQKYIKVKKTISNYYNLKDDLKELGKYFIEDVKFLLKVVNPKLKAIELHVQKSGCEMIPPHQDNFYHCINPEMGLKILLPLQKLNSKNGGLIFLDCDINFPIQKHIASSIKNFSSFIENPIFKKIKKSKTSYNYNPGDASFHFLNSLHYSLGNKTNIDSLFLVFRYQNPIAKVNPIAQTKYNKCVDQHKKLI